MKGGTHLVIGGLNKRDIRINESMYIIQSRLYLIIGLVLGQDVPGDDRTPPTLVRHLHEGVADEVVPPDVGDGVGVPPAVRVLHRGGLSDMPARGGMLHAMVACVRRAGLETRQRHLRELLQVRQERVRVHCHAVG